MSIQIFSTGGTIDDLEYDLEDEVPIDQNSLIPSLVNNANLSIQIEIDEVGFKDSRFINDLDRSVLVKKCVSSTSSQIVITHGTLTMVETAIFIAKQQINKTIVLFGAMIPANKINSDAQFNLGYAISEVQRLAVGVYIAMHGTIFKWDNVIKNHRTNQFEKIH